MDVAAETASATAPINIGNQTDEGGYEVYFRRWWMLLMFCMLIICNATMWVTFAPISDIAETYFGDIGTTTNVNMLAIIFLILYPVGTWLEVICMEKYQLRGTILVGGLLSCTGAAMRVLVAIDPTHSSFKYYVMLLGQMLGALAQPLFMNCPALISAAWFPPSERDTSTALGSLSSALGNALGSVIPVLFVDKSYSDSANESGILQIMWTEFFMCALPLVFAYYFFEGTPPTPPSYSAFLKRGAPVCASVPAIVAKEHVDDLASAVEAREQEEGEVLAEGEGELIELSSNRSVAEWYSTFDQLKSLYRNKNYCYLWFSFCLGLGLFTALMTLINQIVEPYGYNNDEAGAFSAILLVSGLVGAAISAKLLEVTKAYEAVLKAGFIICLFAFVLLVWQLQPNNFVFLGLAFSLTGFGLLPMLPATIENTAECTYPDVAEDLSVGLLFMGGNIVGIVLCSVMQAMLKTEQDKYGDVAADDGDGIDDPSAVPPDSLGSPFARPSNVFMISCLTLAVAMLMFYKGDYRRMRADKQDSDLYGNTVSNGTTSNQLQAPLLDNEADAAIPASMKTPGASMALSQRDTLNYTAASNHQEGGAVNTLHSVMKSG
jgi:MFS transporter, FLVCR family, MFS-domain-containing protein 7